MTRHLPSFAISLILLLLTGCGSLLPRTPSQAWKEGYNLGRSDTAKQQYWIAQNLQRDTRSEPRAKVSYVPIAVPATTNSAGVVTVPTTYKLRFEN